MHVQTQGYEYCSIILTNISLWKSTTWFLDCLHCVVLWSLKSKKSFRNQFPSSAIQKVKVKVKWSRYRPGVAQRVGRGIALLFHDRGTRRGWVASSTPRAHFTPGIDPVPILQEARWAPGPVWTGGKSRPNRDSIPDRPASSQSLYRLSYRNHFFSYIPP